MPDSAADPGRTLPRVPPRRAAIPLLPAPPLRSGRSECVGGWRRGAGPRSPQHPEPGPARSPKPQPRGDGPRRPALAGSLTRERRRRQRRACGTVRAERQAVGGERRAGPSAAEVAAADCAGRPGRGAGPAGVGRAPRLSFKQRGGVRDPDAPASPAHLAEDSWASGSAVRRRCAAWLVLVLSRLLGKSHGRSCRE